MDIRLKETCDYIIARVCEDTRGISPLKLQKLLYYVQAWHLALYDKTFFDGKFQAWIHGPVNRAIYDRFAEQYSLYTPIYPKDLRDFSEEHHFTQEECEFLNAVLNAYAGFSGDQLEELTHREQPWIEARAGIPANRRCENEISERTMAVFYASQTE